jgi:hypothetical protein
VRCPSELTKPPAGVKISARPQAPGSEGVAGFCGTARGRCRGRPHSAALVIDLDLTTRPRVDWVRMPSKKRTPPSKKRTPKEAPSWQIILEDIRSQNRAVMEAMDTRHDEIRQEVRNFRAEVHADLSVIRMLVQSHSIDLRDLKSGLARVEAKAGESDAKTDQVPALAERVAALERRGA